MDNVIASYARIVKQEKQQDGTLKVYGKATDDSLDIDNQICDEEWLQRAMPDWFQSGGNIREQHSNIAAGVAVDYETKSDGHYITALVVDPVSVKKVETGVLKGFSIGIRGPRVIRDTKAANGRIIDGQIVEVSLVDRPANPNAKLMLAKAADDGSLQAVSQITIPSPAVIAQSIQKFNESHDEQGRFSSGDGSGGSSTDLVNNGLTTADRLSQAGNNRAASYLRVAATSVEHAQNAKSKDEKINHLERAQSAALMANQIASDAGHGDIIGSAASDISAHYLANKSTNLLDGDLVKFNENHDEQGRFSSGDDSGSSGSSTADSGTTATTENGEILRQIVDAGNLNEGEIQSQASMVERTAGQHEGNAQEAFLEAAGHMTDMAEHVGNRNFDEAVNSFRNYQAAIQQGFSESNQLAVSNGASGMDQLQTLSDAYEAYFKSSNADLVKFNENHDEQGRFTSGDGEGGGSSSASGSSKPWDPRDQASYQHSQTLKTERLANTNMEHHASSQNSRLDRVKSDLAIAREGRSRSSDREKLDSASQKIDAAKEAVGRAETARAAQDYVAAGKAMSEASTTFRSAAADYRAVTGYSHFLKDDFFNAASQYKTGANIASQAVKDRANIGKAGAVDLVKFNDNHDEQGRFSSGDGGGSGSDSASTSGVTTGDGSRQYSSRSDIPKKYGDRKNWPGGKWQEGEKVEYAGKPATVERVFADTVVVRPEGSANTVETLHANIKDNYTETVGTPVVIRDGFSGMLSIGETAGPSGLTDQTLVTNREPGSPDFGQTYSVFSSNVAPESRFSGMARGSKSADTDAPVDLATVELINEVKSILPTLMKFDQGQYDAAISALSNLIIVEAGEMKDGSDERKSIRELLRSIKHLFHWYDGEAEEGEVPSPNPEITDGLDLITLAAESDCTCDCESCGDGDGCDADLCKCNTGKASNPNLTKSLAVDDGVVASIIEKAATKAREAVTAEIDKLQDALKASEEKSMQLQSDLDAALSKAATGGPKRAAVTAPKKTADGLLQKAATYSAKAAATTDPLLRQGYQELAEKTLRKAERKAAN